MQDPTPTIRALYYASLSNIVLAIIYFLLSRGDFLELAMYLENNLFVLDPASVNFYALPSFFVHLSLITLICYQAARRKLNSESERYDFLVVFLLTFPIIGLFFLTLSVSLGGLIFLGLFLLLIILSFLKQRSTPQQL